MSIVSPQPPATTTKLAAVNDILRRVGLFVVPDLDTGGISAEAEAERALDDAEIRMQRIGWHWNTRTVDVEPDEVTSFITYARVPNARGPLLEVDTAGDSKANGIEISMNADGKLFLMPDNKDVFDSKLTIEIVERLPFGEIPGLFAAWVVAEAAFEFGRRSRYEQDRSRDEARVAEMNKARVAAMRQEIRMADVNLLNQHEHMLVLGRRRTPRWSHYA